MTRRAAGAAAVLLVLGFAALSLTGLGRVPVLQPDEAWQAAPGWGFFTTGHFATPLFAGFRGMERHYYGFLPLSPLLAGASLRAFGLSLVALRLVPLAFASLALLLSHTVGRRVLGEAPALLALVLLVSWPVMAPGAYLTTGLPMADLARIARYDVVVPVCGLLALLCLLPSRDAGRLPPASRFAAAGACCGLATLGHLYGAALLAGILFPLASAGFREAARRALAAGAGFFGALAPYLLFVASGFDDFRAQVWNYGPRFRLASPSFYAANLASEAVRWAPIAQAAAHGRLAPWLFAGAFVVGVLVLGRRALAGDTAWEPRLLLSTVAALAVSFALLLEQKNRMYLAALWDRRITVIFMDRQARPIPQEC